MKPSRAVTALALLSKQIDEALNHAKIRKEAFELILAKLDDGVDVVTVTEEAISAHQGPIEEVMDMVFDAPVPLKADGTPKAKPGRKPKAIAVDQDQNAADIAKLTACLEHHGPLTPGSLISLSGVDAVTINKHVGAAAIIESFVDSDGVILVRLISQRPQA